MSTSKIAGLILGSAALVAGHGYVSGAVVDGSYYGGYIVTQYPYESDPPELIAWSEQETDLGFIDGSGYSSSDIICHKDAKNGALEASVKAGGSVELQWTEWPESHHGPVITYLANCNGDCADVDKTTLEFFKIDQGGLVNDDDVPGTWATDNLISNNNSRTVTIPSDIAAGNYVLRHEIIALHSAGEKNGAQNYPQCLNLKVTGGGSATPSGTLGTELYKNTDAGILVNIYTSLSTYDIPGPTLYTAGGAAATTAAGTSATSTASAQATTSSSVASITPVSSPTTSAVPVPIAVTSTITEGSAPTQTSTASTGSDSGSDSSSGDDSSSTTTTTSSSSTTSSAASSDYNSSDWMSYLSTLSAEEVVKLLHQTFKWLVTDKVHARSLSS